MKPIFISRDGVINKRIDGGVTHRTKLSLIPGSVETMAALYHKGYSIVMLTHQPGLSRGLFDLDELEAIHSQISMAVEDLGGHIHAIFYCPHDESDHCYCRPPATGLLDVAAIELDCDLIQAPYFCDNDNEYTAAQLTGCAPVMCDSSLTLATAAADFLK